jgi:hypothetical protein
MLLIVSPWYTVFSAQLKRFYESLQTIPDFIILCVLGRQEESDEPLPPPPPPPQVEIEVID